MVEAIGFNATAINQQACFDNIELLMWYYYYSYTGYLETDKPWNASVSAARGVATISPVLRGCYGF